MTWWKGDDKLHSHPKVIEAGNEAIGVWMRAATWSAAGGTDGFVPLAVWAMFAPTNWKRVTQRLLDAKAGRTHGLIEPADGGFVIHDFLVDNPSRAAVKLRQAKRAELRGQELNNAVKRRDRLRCRYCRKRTVHADKVGDDGFTYDHVNPGLAEGIDNLVVACRACNRKKWERTPEQAGMTLQPEWTEADLAAFAAEDDLDLGLGKKPKSGPKSKPSPDPAPDLGPDLAPNDLGGTYHRDGTGSQDRSGQNGPGLDGDGSARVLSLRSVPDDSSGGGAA